MTDWREAPKIRRIPIVNDVVQFSQLPAGTACAMERDLYEQLRKLGYETDSYEVRIMPPPPEFDDDSNPR